MGACLGKLTSLWERGSSSTEHLYEGNLISSAASWIGNIWYERLSQYPERSEYDHPSHHLGGWYLTRVLLGFNSTAWYKFSICPLKPSCVKSSKASRRRREEKGVGYKYNDINARTKGDQTHPRPRVRGLGYRRLNGEFGGQWDLGLTPSVQPSRIHIMQASVATRHHDKGRFEVHTVHFVHCRVVSVRNKLVVYPHCEVSRGESGCLLTGPLRQRS